MTEKERRNLNFKEKTEEKPKSRNAKEAWERIAAQILTAARQELYLSMRYFYLALEQMPGRADSRINWFGTDGAFLYYQPMRLAQAYEQDAILINRVCLHSVLHGMFGHMYRRQEREQELWDLACDIVVEELIDGLSLRPLQRLVPPERERCYEWLAGETKIASAERVYEALKTLKTLPSAWETLFRMDDHSFWKSQEESSPSEQEQQKREQELWRETREKVQTELETYARTAGIEKTKLYQELAAVNREKTDYREFLLKFSRLRETPRLDLDSFDYGYYEYGRKLYGNMPLIEELEYREEAQLQELAVVIDTSGSCSKELVSRFLEETVTILEEAGGQEGRTLCCHILQCDNQIQEEQTVYTLQELQQYLKTMQIVGRGGTDFRLPFWYAEEKKKNGEWKDLSGLLYFTDGYGVYPNYPPDFETVFLFPEESWQEGKPPWKSENFPVWAMHLELSLEEQTHSKGGERRKRDEY